jgi:hypothetical protein
VLTGFRRPFTLQNLDALGHLNVPSERQFRLHVLAFGGARLFSMRCLSMARCVGCVSGKGKNRKGRKVAMTNAEIISEVNGLLKMALGLLETIENKLPAEEAHPKEALAEDAHLEEAQAEEAHAEELRAVEVNVEEETREKEVAENVPPPAAQANVAEAIVVPDQS